MKTIFLTIACLLYSTLWCNSAEWAPIGTQWYYDYNAPYAFGYILMESKKDTLIDGKSCRVLTLNQNSYASPGVFVHEPYDTIITYQVGSKVYIHQRNEFSLFFDFDPAIGDIWDLNGASEFRKDSINCNGGKVIVDSVKQITIDNQQLNEIYTSPYMGSLLSFGGSIIEGIGCLKSVYPWSSHPCSPVVDYPETLDLRCFYSVKMDSTFTTTECDYINTLPELSMKNTLQLFPNPARESLKLVCQTNLLCYPVTAVVFSVTGAKCFSLNLSDDEEINISRLAPGSYILKINDSKSADFQLKFMKK